MAESGLDVNPVIARFAELRRDVLGVVDAIGPLVEESDRSVPSSPSGWKRCGGASTPRA